MRPRAYTRRHPSLFPGPKLTAVRSLVLERTRERCPVIVVRRVGWPFPPPVAVVRLGRFPIQPGSFRGSEGLLPPIASVCHLVVRLRVRPPDVFGAGAVVCRGRARAVPRVPVARRKALSGPVRTEVDVGRHSPLRLAVGRRTRAGARARLTGRLPVELGFTGQGEQCQQGAGDLTAPNLGCAR